MGVNSFPKTVTRQRLVQHANHSATEPPVQVVTHATFDLLKRYGVRPSVCSSQYGPTAANPLLHVCCCRLGGQEISIACCSSGMRRANAGSAKLSAYVAS